MTDDTVQKDDLVHDPAAASAAGPAPSGSEVEPDAAPATEAPARPDGVPDKFWDPATGAVRTDSLLKSYRDLERKLGKMVALPAGDDDAEGHERLRRALGVPASSDDYQIEARNELIQPDPEVNARLHQAGLNQRQAQMVYDLASDYLVPLVDDALASVAAERDAERLAGRFGGSDQWRAVADQIKTWGKANLPPETMEVLSSSYEGVLAMHQMMQAREPSVVNEGDGVTGAIDEAALQQMMRDPRYWRDRDPALIAQVTEGFSRLYSK